MAASIPRYHDIQYKAWLKSQLGLHELRDALCPVTQKVITALHARVKAKLGTPTGAKLCCSETNVVFDRASKQCKLACRTNICDKWVLEISQNHINPQEIKWSCTKLADWVVQPWELAKLFLPRGQLKGTSTPDQHDPAALFNLLMKCKEFHGWKNHSKLVEPLIQIRNKLCHSANLKVNATDMIDNFQKMIDFLNHPALVNDVDVDVPQLQSELLKIRDTDVYITPAKETNVIAQLLQDMMTRLNELHTKCGRLETAGAKHDADMQELEDRVDEMRIFCQFLGDQEDLLERMPHDLITAKNDLERHLNEIDEKLASHVGDLEEVVKTAGKKVSKAKAKATFSKSKARMASGKITNVEDKVENHERRIVALEGHFKSHSREYAHVADQMNVNKTEISTLKKEYELLIDRLSAAEQEREQLMAQFNSMKEKDAVCLRAKQLSSSRPESRKRAFVDEGTEDVKHIKGEEEKVSAKASSSEQSATSPYSPVDITYTSTDRHQQHPRRGKNIAQVASTNYRRNVRDYTPFNYND